MNDANHKDLIDSLTQNFTGVKTQPHPAFLTVGSVILISLCVWAVASLLGIRPDIDLRMTEISFTTDIALAAAIGLSGSIAIFLLTVPDMRGLSWFPAVPFTLAVTFLGLKTMQMTANGLETPTLYIFQCIAESLLFVTVPMAALIVLTKKIGAPTRPAMLMTMNALTVSAFGYIGLRIVCMFDSPAYDAMYHIAPFLVFGMLIGLVARRIYTW